MPSQLKKVQKQVAKKKGKNVRSLHENSRDALRLRRAGARDERVVKGAVMRQKTVQHWLDRVTFFQSRLPETLHPMDLDQIKELIHQFLCRHEDEIDRLHAERRQGRPPSNRLTLLMQQQKTEAQEYESGFWMPDLQDAETLIKLDAWNGDYVALAVLRFARVAKLGGVTESQFPPRGS